MASGSPAVAKGALQGTRRSAPLRSVAQKRFANALRGYIRRGITRRCMDHPVSSCVIAIYIDIGSAGESSRAKRCRAQLLRGSAAVRSWNTEGSSLVVFVNPAQQTSVRNRFPTFPLANSFQKGHLPTFQPSDPKKRRWSA
jgi:hypothetical protein